MTVDPIFKIQALNNAFANHRLGQACLQVPAAELSAERTGFFPSIIATLNHILIVDWYYVSALEGHCAGPAVFADPVPCPDMGDYVVAQRKVDDRLVSLCADPALARRDRSIELPRGSKTEVDRFDRVFLHLIQHQIHHRGQAHCMLSGTRVAPPQLDEFYLSWQADVDLRRDDLAALDTTEAEVWKDF